MEIFEDEDDFLFDSPPQMLLQSFFAISQVISISGDQERLERWDKIAPCFVALRRGRPPPSSIPLADLENIGSLLKAEGNSLYENSLFELATHVYSAAVDLGFNINLRRSTPVIKQRLSTFLSNRAACYLKMGFFYLEDCICDCDLAIHFNIDNMKAYYRKATALKLMSQYESALEMALIGQKRAGTRSDDARAFDSLIREIRSRLPVAVLSAAATLQDMALMSGFDAATIHTETEKGRKKRKRSKRKKKKPVTAAAAAANTDKTETASENDSDGEETDKRKQQNIAAAQTSTKIEQPTKNISKPTSRVADVETRKSLPVNKNDKPSGKTNKVAMLKADDKSQELGASFLPGGGTECKKRSSTISTSSAESGWTAVSSDRNYVGKFSALDLDDDDSDDGSTDNNVDEYYFSDEESKNYSHMEGSQGALPSVTAKAEACGWETVVNSRKITIPVTDHSTSTSSTLTQQSTMLTKHKPAGTVPSKSAVAVPFPLGRYDYYIRCHACYKDGWSVRVPQMKHDCNEDTLVVEEKETGECFRIRERKNHSQFPGKYHMCNQCPDYRTGRQCPRRNACCFSHNKPEWQLWNLEKAGKFDIREFIVKVSGKPTVVQLHTLGSFLTEFPGKLDFLCRVCFTSVPCLSMRSPSVPSKCSLERHPWQSSAILAHRSPDGNISLIGRCPVLTQTAVYNLCLLLEYCKKKWTMQCISAHSVLERELWYVERDCNITQEQIVAQAREFTNDHHVEQGRSSSASLVLSLPPSRSSSIASLTTISSGYASNSSPSVRKSTCPLQVVAVCSTCWKKAQTRSAKSSNGDKCNGPGHSWNSSNVTYLILPCKKILGLLPIRYPRDLSFSICWDVLNKGKCCHDGCHFAHSEEEIKVWKWMAQNNVRDLQAVVDSWPAAKDVIQKSAPSAKPQASAPIVGQTRQVGQVVAAAVPSKPAWGAAPQAAVGTKHLEFVASYYCNYCSVYCNSEYQLNTHCSSTKHKLSINSDKERQWNFRPPPLDVSGNNYILCSRHRQHRCRYSDLAEGDLSNYCRFAHSEAELDEWKERFNWRQMKKNMAKEQHLYSYMDQLIDDINAAKNLSSVLVEFLEGIQINCSNELNFSDVSKNATNIWTFRISSNVNLVRVALLYDEHRLHFLFDGVPETYQQHLHGDSLRRLAGSNLYQIKVKFVGGLFGNFSQTVVFDFGQRPVLAKKLRVELGDRLELQKVEDLRMKLDFKRWTKDNCEIVEFGLPQTASQHELNNEILSRYNAPSHAEEVVTQSAIGTELNQNNYVHRMHQLLSLEEFTQARLISEFNIEATVKILAAVVDEVYIAAQNGELFVRVPLGGQLNEDTDAGHLVLWLVTSAFLTTKQGRATKRVYEAPFVENQQLNFRGRLRDAVYLHLSQRCCTELALEAGMEVVMEIQFQMNRLLFCQMHYSLDQLNCTDLIFPDISRIITLSSNTKQDLKYKCLSKYSDFSKIVQYSYSVEGSSEPAQFESLTKSSGQQLNDLQLKIVDYVVRKKRRMVAPLVVYGAFGTGKTETLAQAATMLASQPNNDVRILICTHTNAAADEYILRHFDKLVMSGQRNITVLRVYDPERLSKTVNLVVQKYCLLSSDKLSFSVPTHKDIIHHRVVITTLVTSLLLSKLDVKGHFTHIFIDEAAQVHECQTIMPLSLANETTCIVLAGDHLQMGQRVYSTEARELKFDRSIVERLHLLYESAAKKSTVDLSGVPLVHLKANYRNNPEILRFLSASFYGGEDVLLSCTTQLEAAGVVALNFYAALGEETQDERSTSWYNAAEIDEVVERVCHLYESWPAEWGEKDAKSILVTTAYSDQANNLRQALRRKRLGAVTVLRVHNLPGMEFRAVIVSTVRSRHLFGKMTDEYSGEYGFLSELKMVNTALTRAKSWLAVVGDPVALCSIGACQQLWRTYLKHCEKLGSLQPKGLSLEDVWMQGQQLTSNLQEQLPKIHDNINLSMTGLKADEKRAKKPAEMQQPAMLSANAKPFSDRRSKTGTCDNANLLMTDLKADEKQVGLTAMEVQQPILLPANTKRGSAAHVNDLSGCKQTAAQMSENQLSKAPVDTVNKGDALARMRQKLWGTENSASGVQVKVDSTAVRKTVNVSETAIESKKSGLDVISFKEWSLDFQLEPDEIIRQLAMSGKETEAQQNVFADMWPVMKDDNIHVHIKEGHAFLHHRTATNRQRRRKLVSGNDFAADYDSASDESDSDEDASEYSEFSTSKLAQLLETNPDVYKRCILNIERLSNIHAKPLDRSISRILFSSRKRCGRAFHGDEVVVKILSSDEARYSHNSSELLSMDSTAKTKLQKKDGDENLPWGEVVGILKRSLDPKYRMFICRVDEDNTGMMLPLNMGVPKIYNLERQENPTPKGKVAVYTFTKSKHIIFDRFEKISDDSSVLFIVRFLKWDMKHASPLGIVVGTLPAGVTFEQASTILDIEYSIPRRFREATSLQLKKLCLSMPSGVLPPHAFRHRNDYRSKLVFTIDPPESTDLDDALSFEKVSSSCYIIGIHIADVSFFVDRSTNIDMEAKMRGSSFYPAIGEPIPMLPSRLSEDLCSLLPNRDRLTVSVFITINTRADIQNVHIERTVITSKYRLCYADAEAMIDGDPESHEFPEELVTRIQSLNRTAQLWRRRRLGCEAMCLPLDISTLDGPKAHALVEELMIAANHHVAQKLVERFQTMTVLRCQGPPDETELDDWKTRFVEAARNTVVLTRPFCPPGRVCQCDNICTCLPDTDTGIVLPNVTVMSSTWSKIESSVIALDMEKTQSLMLTPDYHPQLAIAAQGLRMIQNRSGYVCSGDLPDNESRNHYSLNLSAYTHFTSPIRRYVDLVIHRLIGNLLEETSVAYSPEDISEICTHCTDVSVRSRRYENASYVAQFCDLLQRRPLVLHAIVDKPSDADFHLLFPTIRKFFPSSTKVKLSSLNISGKPVVDEEHFELTLKWSQRIYYNSLERDSLPLSRTCNLIELYRDHYVIPVQARRWNNLLNATITEDQQDIVTSIADINQNFTVNHFDEPVSEGVIVQRGKHFCDYSLKLNAGCVIKVQLSTELYRGLLQPCVQLFYITPSTCVCIQHIKEAVHSFSKPATRKAIRDRYSDIASYKKLWLPLIEAEAAFGAVANEHSAIIHNIAINWQHVLARGIECYTGTFSLPVSFCEERCIMFSADTEPGAHETVDDMSYQPRPLDDRCVGYICVRYSDLSIPAPQFQLPIDQLVNVQEKITWVGHCLVSKVTYNKEKTMYTVHLRLHQKVFPIPDQILTSNTSKATVEWLAKCLPDRRMEVALHTMSAENSLDSCIALGRQCRSLDTTYVQMAFRWTTFAVPNLRPANVVQQQAVANALTQPFTLIQGPPGTGKTVTAVRLASLFVRLNYELSSDYERNGVRPQIMVCGPSNKSVDVVANYLKDISESAIKLVRVYSKTVENEDFPMPDHLVTHKTRAKLADSVRDMRLQSISLHHLIREGDSEAVIFIRAMDARLRAIAMHPAANTERPTDDEKKKYKEYIVQREKEVLGSGNIILCTCSGSGAMRLRKTTNITQLIIDECAMCKEAESLIPIVALKPEQVVLVGDHQQLQPIILEKSARKYGLGRSLFERYALSRLQECIMLTIQYRMHKAIMAFPSEQFYESRLVVGNPAVQNAPSQFPFWPGGADGPIAFLNVVGHEETLTVATEEGSEQSKSNMDEVQLVAFIVRSLVRRYDIQQKDIAVLSQYRAQSSLITETLHEHFSNVNVSTVVAAQGSEWDYVILSTVRSLPPEDIDPHPSLKWKGKYLGFITDCHQINVAITRARKGLVIIGNKHLLCCDEMWRRLLEHYESRQKLLNGNEFMI